MPAGSGGGGGGRFPGGRAAPGGRCAVPGGPLVCTAAGHTLRLLPALCRVVLCPPPRPRCLGSSSRPDPHPGWLPRRRGRPPRRAAAEALPCARQAPAVSTMGWAWFSLNPPPPPGSVVVVPSSSSAEESAEPPQHGGEPGEPPPGNPCGYVAVWASALGWGCSECQRGGRRLGGCQRCEPPTPAPQAAEGGAPVPYLRVGAGPAYARARVRTHGCVCRGFCADPVSPALLQPSVQPRTSHAGGTDVH